MTEVLSWINSILDAAKIPYEFLEWTQPVRYPYFVGDCSELEPNDESGLQEKTFTLTGFCRGSGARLKLIQVKNKVEELFPPIGGKTAVLEDGSGIAVFYANSFFIPSGEEELYKIQISLSVKLWKVV